MPGNFTPAEIIDLIDELGHLVEFGVLTVTQQADPNYAIAEQRSYAWRSLKAYVAEDNNIEISVINSDSAQVGGLKVYAYASDATPGVPGGITRQELDNASGRIRYENRQYQYQYVMTHRDRTIPRLHELVLLGAG